MIKKKRLASGFVSFALLPGLISCTSAPFTANPGGQDIQEFKSLNNSKIANSITLSIKADSFNLKASQNGVPARTQANVKSYSAFLTTNKINPFAAGANIGGTGFMLSANKSLPGQPDTITFTNLPVGGPYFAVAAAFDSTRDDVLRKNITNPNPAITGPLNKWSVSLNSVTVLPDLTMIFSNGLQQLDVQLQLENTLPPVIETVITPQSGTSAGVFSAS